MKKAIHLYVYFACCMFPLWSLADHISGGEMSYRFLSSQNDMYNYEVKLRLLMRCNSGRMFPNPIIIGVFSKIDNFRVADVQVPLTSQRRISLGSTDPCVSNAPDVCFEVAEYIFPISLPANDSGYLLVASVNFRVNGLANLSEAGNVGATYTADIPGSAIEPGSVRNNSAYFTGSDLVVVCANSPFTYSFSALDDDGDSLEYSFCGAYGTGSFGGSGANSIPPSPPPYALVNYGTYFGPDKPLGLNVNINPATGLVTGIAPDIGIYVITVCVAEKRNGRVIAVQRKDIQLNITGCTVAAALLKPNYKLCSDLNEITLENLSGSPLIQSYNWELFSQNGEPVAVSTSPRFIHQFTDTGRYKVVLKTNVDLTCPDSTAAEVLFYPGLKANFTYRGICFGKPTQFFNASTTRYGSIDSYFWDLGEPINSINYQTKAFAEMTYQVSGQKSAFLRVSNANGCTDSVSIQLAVSSNPPIDLNFRDTLICPPDTLQIMARGGGNIVWDIIPGIVSETNSPNIRVAPMVTTQYFVTQNLDNCISRDSIRVRVSREVELSTMNDTTICAGDAIILRTEGNGTRFQWTPEVGLNANNSAFPQASPLQTTRYRVTSFISACSRQDEIIVTTVPYPTLIAGQDIAICFGQSVNLSAVTNGNRLQWSPAVSLNNSSVNNPIASPVETTSYMVAAYDDEGCPKPSFDTMVVKVEPLIRMQGVKDTSIVIGQPLQMMVTGAPSFSWTPNFNISNPAIGNPVIRYNQPTEGVKYKVIGFNSAGCSDSLEFTLKVFSTVPTVFVPTAFTPNRDGLNEVLKPTLAGMKQLDYFRIFNRYGQLVFETRELNKGWDGELQGKLQPSGSFVWLVQAVDYEGKPVHAKGSTLLIR